MTETESAEILRCLINEGNVEAMCAFADVLDIADIGDPKDCPTVQGGYWLTRYEPELIQELDNKYWRWKRQDPKKMTLMYGCYIHTEIFEKLEGAVRWQLIETPRQRERRWGWNPEVRSECEPQEACFALYASRSEAFIALGSAIAATK